VDEAGTPADSTLAAYCNNQDFWHVLLAAIGTITPIFGVRGRGHADVFVAGMSPVMAQCPRRQQPPATEAFRGQAATFKVGQTFRSWGCTDRR
jgi:hypothetical protein